MILLDAVSIEGWSACPKLTGISLQVPAGEVHAVIAEEVACVAKIADLIAGRICATAGSVRICSLDPSADPVAARRRIGLVWPRGLDGRITVRENAHTILRLCGQADVGDTALEDALRRSEVPDRVLDRPAADLRGRDTAAIWLALATLRQTPVIVCIHFGSTLGAADVRHLAKLLRQSAQDGLAVLVLDSTAALARLASATVHVIRRGRLVTHAEHTPQEPLLGAESSDSLQY